jgi:hypothetical protein
MQIDINCRAAKAAGLDVDKLKEEDRKTHVRSNIIRRADVEQRYYSRDLQEDPDTVIAAHVCPPKGDGMKTKGWAWRKGGLPVDFADPSQTTALVAWASRQPFWKEQSTDGQNTWGSHYASLAQDHGESRLSKLEFAHAVRNLVFRALTSPRPSAEQVAKPFAA